MGCEIILLFSIADGVSEDLIIALRKRAEIEYKHLVMFDKDDPHEMKQSLNRSVDVSIWTLSVSFVGQSRSD